MLNVNKIGSDSDLWMFVLSHPIAGGEKAVEEQDEVESPDDDQDQLEREGSSEDSDKELSEGDKGEERTGHGEEGIDYKKRYADTKTDRDTLKAEADRLRTEVEQFRLEKEKGQTIDDTQLERQFFDEIYGEVSTLDPNDTDKTKKVYGAIAKGIAKAVKLTREQAVRDITIRSKEADLNKTKDEKNKSEAEEMARIALEEVGLDREKNYSEFIKETDRIMASRPAWFKVVPGEQQFMKIANMVKNRLEKVTKENEEHRKEAGGMMGSGSKVIKKKRPADEEDDDSPDNMVGALSLLRTQRKNDAAKAYKMSREL